MSERDTRCATLRYWDVRWQRPGVQVLAGEYFLSQQEMVLSTVLGSCIATCLWDTRAHIGAMNHFLLPGNAAPGERMPGRYGGHALHTLVQAMLKSGAQRQFLQAKIFGGARIIHALADKPVGPQNTAFVRRWLQREKIPVTAQDVLGRCPRKLLFFPASGTALLKRLPDIERGNA